LLSARLRSETSDDVSKASGKCVRKKWNRIANSGTEVAYPGHADIAAIDDLFQLLDLVFSKVFRALSGDRHILTMLVVVFIGETIKFDLVHVTVQIPVLDELRSLNCLRSDPAVYGDAMNA
jgi:hypothetical protein